MPRVPKLRRHTSGQWFVHWGGKRHYLGHDRAEAAATYLEHLKDWAVWLKGRRAARVPAAQSVLLVDLAEHFLETKQLETGWDLRRYYGRHLRRFTRRYGRFRADSIRVRHLQALKEDMLGLRFAPKTINHDLTAVRVLFRWATGLEYLPPVAFSGCKNLPLGPPPDKSLSIGKIRAMIRKSPDNLAAWLATTYTALLRPSETIRCVHGQGRWVEPGIFRLDRGKMDRVTSLQRHCIFSREALGWLKRCRPVWSRLDSFSQAVRDIHGYGGPSVLRHSAASHLVRLGARVEDIELLLGHVPPRLRLTYYQPPWQRLRRTAARISVRACG